MKTRGSVGLTFCLVFAFSILSLSVALASYEVPEFVRALYSFDTEESVIGNADAGIAGWFGMYDCQEVVWNTNSEFVKAGEGSIGFRTQYKGDSHRYSDIRIVFGENPQDWSAGRYVGFWFYLGEDRFLYTYDDTFVVRVYVNSAGAGDIEAWIPSEGPYSVKKGWNFVLIDLQAPSADVPSADAPKDQVWYKKGGASTGLNSSQISRFIIRLNASAGMTNYWCYVDEMSLYN